MRPASVLVGYLHPGEVSHSFSLSMLKWQAYDAAHNRHLAGYIAEECGAGRIVDGRNSVVRQFLSTTADWLMFIDADMGFEPDEVDRLLEVADPDGRPIVGGLAFSARKGPETSAGARRLDIVPTIYRWADNGAMSGYAPMFDYPRDRLVECDATGAAFFVCHRSVFEKVAEAHPGPRQWFDEMVDRGQVFGEDLTFFRRCQDAGFPIWVHTGVKTSHYKHHYLDELTAGDLTRVPNYVVIPMKDRMDLTRQLLKQLVDQGEADGIFVFDNGSNRETKNELATLNMDGVEVFDADGANIHQMWNAGLAEATRRSWPCNVAILNNDIEIGDRFLSGLATALRADPYLAIVGPNYDSRQGDGVVYVEEVCAGRYDGTGGLPGFAFMLKGEAQYRFPEQLRWWYGDNDMVASCLWAGSKVGLVLGTSCVHVDGGSQTGDWDDPEMQQVLEADRDWFETKWARVRAAA